MRKLLDTATHTISVPDFDLAVEKTSLIESIKSEANKRISELDWKVTKYSEQNQRGKGKQAEYDATLDEREQIRLDSDDAEIAVNALTTIEGVKAFAW